MENRQDAKEQTWGSLFRRMGLVVLGFTITTLVHVLAMVKGWGLEPKSWLWIVGAGIFGLSFVRMFVENLLEKKE